MLFWKAAFLFIYMIRDVSVVLNEVFLPLEQNQIALV